MQGPAMYSDEEMRGCKVAPPKYVEDAVHKWQEDFIEDEPENDNVPFPSVGELIARLWAAWFAPYWLTWK